MDRLLPRIQALLHRVQGFRPDIPFDREDATRYLPWVVGLMVALSGLLLAASISIHDASSSASRLNANHFQIYIPHGKQQDALAAQARAALDDLPGVARIEPLRDATIADLIAPWTGRSLDLNALPLPLVLEVTIAPDAARETLLAAIEERLQAIDSGIEVESYQQWVEQLLQFTFMLRLLALALALLMLLGLTAIIVIAARTSLKLHFRAVQLLHHIGATDDYILRQFVLNAVSLMLRGALPGTLAAAILFACVCYASGALSSPLLPPVEWLGLHVLLFLLLPVLSAAAAFAAVRSTVRQMLLALH